MSSSAVMLLATWSRRMAAVMASPLLVAVIASSTVALVTDVKNALATVIEY